MKEEAERHLSLGGGSDPKRPRLLHGVLVMRDNKLVLMDPEEACASIGIPVGNLRVVVLHLSLG